VPNFFKKVIGGISNAAGSLTESAVDPRSIQTDQREPHLDSLKQVQNARYEIDVALEHLEVLSGKARESFTAIEEQIESDEDATSQRFSQELMREIRVEISSIERQEEHLRRQQEVLLMSERRLVAGIRRGAVSRQLEGATSASSQAKEAADSALRDAGTDMRRLDAVINSARAATERLEDQSKVIDRMAGRAAEGSGGSAGGEDRTQPQLAGEHRILAGFEDIQSGEYGDELRRLAEQGGIVTGKLVSEYQQLELSIRRHESSPVTPGSKLAIAAARTFRQGLQSAETALEELTSLSFNTDVEVPGRFRLVAEKIADVGRTESAIYRSRLEFIALVKGDDDATQEAVFEALEQLGEDDA
jgi:hypothetical protein